MLGPNGYCRKRQGLGSVANRIRERNRGGVDGYVSFVSYQCPLIGVRVVSILMLTHWDLTSQFEERDLGELERLEPCVHGTGYLRKKLQSEALPENHARKGSSMITHSVSLALCGYES